MQHFNLVVGLILLLSSLSIRATASDAIVRETLKLLHDGEQNMELHGNRDSVLVLGTGTDKFIVTQLLTANQENIFAVRNGSKYVYAENSNLLTLSKSNIFYPVLKVDEETNTPFYVLPDLPNNKNQDISKELATQYFTYKVVDYSKHIKLLVVIDNDWIKNEISNQFYETIQQITYFTNDINKFQNSILLIVTNVANDNKNDLTILRDIKKQLELANTDLKSRIKGTDSFHSMAKNLITILFNNVIFLRNPSGTGSLTNMKKNEQNIEQLSNTVTFKVSFLKHLSTDITYALSSTAKQYISQINTKLTKLANETTSMIYAEMRNLVISKIVKIGNIFDIYDFYKGVSEYFSLKRNNMIMSDNIIDIAMFLRSVDINLNTTNLKYFIKYSEQVNFFQSMMSSVTMSEMKMEFSLSDYFKEQYNYYNNLIKIYNLYQTYEVQQLIKEVNYRSHNYSDTNEKLTEHMFKLLPYWQRNDRTIQSWFQSVKTNSCPHNTQFARFVFISIYTQSVRLPKNGDECKVIGTNIFLNDIIRRIKYNECKSIVVFATGKVYIQDDIFLSVNNKASYACNLYIFTPELYVSRNNIKIVLDGVNGENQAKAVSKYYNGENGEDGLPGRPGANAGNFFAVVGKFSNRNQLIVQANGGNAGNGQNGGDGAKGSDGTDTRFESYYYNENYKFAGPADQLAKFKEKYERYPFNYEVTEYVKNEKLIFDHLFFFERSEDRDVRLDIGRNNGGKGGNGGNGGRGGVGGTSGTINVFTLNGISTVTSISRSGLSGRNGEGGRAGEGGKNGNSLLINLYAEHYYHWFLFKAELRRVISKGSVESGTVGSISSVLAEKHNTQNENLFKKYLTDYRSYLVQQINENPIFKKDLILTLKAINSNNRLFNSFTILDHINEFLSLENTLNDNGNYNLLKEQYLHLRLRLESQMTQQTSDMNFKKARNILYVAILNRMDLISRGTTPFTTVDIKDKFEKLKTNADELLKSVSTAHTVATITSVRENFKNEIQDEIKNSNELVSVLINDVNNLFDENDQNIQKLVQETQSFQQSAQNNFEELKKNKEILQNTAFRRKLLSIVKVIGSIAGVLTASGDAINQNIDAINSVIPEARVSQTKTFKGPPSIDKAFNFDFNKEMNTEINNFQSELQCIKMNTQTANSNLSSTIRQIASQSLAMIPPRTTRQFTSLYNSVKINYQKAIAKLYSDKNKDEFVAILNINCMRAKRSIVSTIKNVTQVFTSVSAAAVQLFHSDPELAAVENEIEKNRAEYQKLIRFENDIFDNLVPSIMKMRDSIQKALNTNVEDVKSLSELDVLGYSLINVARDVSRTVSKFTEGFESQDNLVYTFTKMRDALETVVKVFVRIKEYQDKKRQADYIADLVTPMSITLTFSDPVLSKAVEEMQFRFRANLLYENYDTAVKIFKQWAFPFAPQFVREISFLGNSRQNKTVNELTNDIKNKLDILIRKVSSFKTTIVREIDSFIFKEAFTSDHKFSKPFFTWNSENALHEISELLSEKPVVFQASLNPNDMNFAIKFNEIRLRFKSDMPDIQSTLDRLLIDNYKVKMTHMGNSAYRCGEKSYIIGSEPQTLEYSFGRNEETGKPLSYNSIYEKMKSGTIFLSPYALWMIQLLKRGATATNNTLYQYRRNIRIELSGMGQSVSPMAPVCQTDLSQFYESNEALSNEMFHLRMSNVMSGRSQLIFEDYDSSINMINRTRERFLRYKQALPSVQLNRNTASAFSSHYFYFLLGLFSIIYLYY